MISILKILLLSSAVFVVLSIHIANEPLFNHVNKITEPYTLELIDSASSKIKVLAKKSITFVRQFFSNSNPKNDDFLQEAINSANKKAIASIGDAVNFFNQKENQGLQNQDQESNDSDNGVKKSNKVINGAKAALEQKKKLDISGI
ncbi:MAG: hypothetical protein HQK51_10265 [Oligoflexia bacterium]|nr:hypothetical protein [Oligoflexia bacterium]